VETASNSGRRDVQLLAEDCQEALKVERERKKMARRRHQEERKGSDSESSEEAEEEME